jgi:hypothetical protein
VKVRPFRRSTSALVVRQRLAVVAIGLAVAEPFLQNRVAAELIGPDGLGDMGEVGLSVDIEVTGALSPHS